MAASLEDEFAAFEKELEALEPASEAAAVASSASSSSSSAVAAPTSASSSAVHRSLQRASVQSTAAPFLPRSALLKAANAGPGRPSSSSSSSSFSSSSSSSSVMSSAAPVLYSEALRAMQEDDDTELPPNLPQVTIAVPRQFPQPARANGANPYTAALLKKAGGDAAVMDVHADAKAANVKKKRILRTAADKVWEDGSMADWPEDDYRIFCGDLGNEVNDSTLSKVFSRYPSFAKAKVVRDKATGKSKGYGFVSFLDPYDCAKALKELNGKYVGNRPVKLKKSTWKERDLSTARKKKKQKK